MNYRVLWLQTQQSFEVGADESVLDAATRQGVDLPHDCTFGGCGTCRMKVEEGSFAYADGELPLAMSDEEHAEGYALACQARAQSDLVISVETGPVCSAPTQLRATVAEIRLHTPDIYHLALDLPSDHGVQYAPGQYLNICLPGGEHRSFSMSSPQQGNRVTLQIRKIAGSRFTEQMLARTQPGDVLDVELPQAPIYLWADRRQLRRALLALLSNAIKFTAPGSLLRLTLTRRGKRAYLRLTDGGEGMTPEVLTSAFSRYAQPQEQDDPRAGAGFSLPVVQAVIQAHGGTILLQSQKDAGTDVTLTLPIGLPQEQTLLRSPRVTVDRSGGFVPELVELSDALPPEAYDVQNFL